MSEWAAAAGMVFTFLQGCYVGWFVCAYRNMKRGGK